MIFCNYGSVRRNASLNLMLGTYVYNGYNWMVEK